MRIAIIGQGYVGLTITAGAVEVGHQVVGVDKNELVVEGLNSGRSHIEGIDDNLLKGALKSGNFKATGDFKEIIGCEIVVVAVPTPLDSRGKPDLTLLESACDSIAPLLNQNTLVINESTSFAGTLRNVIAARINAINASVQYFAISPERVDPGNKNYGVKNTPRLVGGLNSKSTEMAAAFYSTFCSQVVKVSSPEVAEAAKLLENTFRFVNIGFINEFTNLMNSMGIPALEVIDAAATKPYGYMKFTPNVGIGGHCIPVDPLYLQKNADEIGVATRFISLSDSLNQEMPGYAIKRLEQLHGSLVGQSILVVGVSYKPNIADTRETPAEHVIDGLKELGAKVSWHDPLISNFNGTKSSAVSGDYDLALVLVAHDSLDFRSWNGNPIYCVNFDPKFSDWIPILGESPKD
jgi:UDP-N-acetyl-D-glucosamine dehydrogenase